MEGQGQSDRYGNPVRQQQQHSHTYPQSYPGVAGQPFSSGYGQSRGAQAQIGAATAQIGTASAYPTQSGSQRPGSTYGGYGQPFNYGDFGQDPGRQQYPNMMGYPYPPPASDYPMSYRQTQTFPDYYDQASYSAAPATPTHIQHHQPPTYGHHSRGRTSNPSPYSTMPSYTAFETQGQMPPPVQPQPESSRPNDAYRAYLRKLRETYDYIQTGRLAQGGQSLLDASEALLSRVDELGLARDDETLHEQRLKMWKDFNHCWLGFMQKLKDHLMAIVRTGAQLTRPQSIVTPTFLDTMAEKLIAWVDLIEKWGLVDYETGVWEEEILELAGDCRTIFEANADAFVAVSAHQNPPP